LVFNVGEVFAVPHVVLQMTAADFLFLSGFWPHSGCEVPHHARRRMKAGAVVMPIFDQKHKYFAGEQANYSNGIGVYGALAC
jgi:hypothetical protein